MKRALFFALLVSLFMSYGSYAEEKIIWHHADFPPAFILHGENAGKGYCNRMENDAVEFIKE